MVTEATKLAQLSWQTIFKVQTKEKINKLSVYGIALVSTKQVVVPAKGSVTFT